MKEIGFEFWPSALIIDTMLNNYLSQKLKFIGTNEFNHLIYMVTPHLVKEDTHPTPRQTTLSQLTIRVS